MTLWDVWTKGLDLERSEALTKKQKEMDDDELAHTFEGLGIGAQVECRGKVGSSGRSPGGSGEEEEVWEELFSASGWDRVSPSHL
jgi:hypothetical protein